MTKPTGDVDKLSPAVILTGTAKDGILGPHMGVVDIGISDKAYLCRVTLPGLRKNECNLSYDIKRDGMVNIRGVITSLELTRNSTTEHQMIVQELYPPEMFGISFCLPGPVDPRLISPNFRPDGILEIVVFKFSKFGFEVDLVLFSSAVESSLECGSLVSLLCMNMIKSVSKICS